MTIRIGPSVFVAFSPDSRWLAVGSEDAVRVREVAKSSPSIPSRMGKPASAVFSPASDALLVKRTDGALYRWSSPFRSTKLVTFSRSRGEGPQPAFVSDGRHVINGTWKGTLELLDSASGRVTWEETFPGIVIKGTLPLADTSTVLVCCAPVAPSTIERPPPAHFERWSLEPKPQSKEKLSTTFASIVELALAPDHCTVAVVHGAPPDTLSLLDTATGRILRETPYNPGGAGSAVAWSAQGSLAVVHDHAVVLYSKVLEPLTTIPLEYASSIAFSPDGQQLALGSWDDGMLMPMAEVLPSTQK